MRTLRKIFIFFWKDLLNLFSYKLGSILYILSIFIPLIIFYFLSQLFGKNLIPEISMYSKEYFPFVLIGLAFSNYFIFGMNSLSSTIRNEQMMGTLESMLSTPTTIPTIIFSSVLFDFLLTSVQIFLYLIIGKIFFSAPIYFDKWASALLLLMLTITSFGAFGILSASFIIVFKKGNPLALVITQSSILFGGVYYPYEMLPEWIQVISKILPMTHALRGFRYLLLKNVEFKEIITDLTFLLIFSIVFLPISIFIFSIAVRKAKKDGTLIQY